ncbi:MAG TPA: hypothetical protein VFV28_10320 [Limnobacter sp.]|nr:hypothetical protein [Limnobacter sp.]
MENRPVSIDSKCEGSGASKQCTVIFAVHQDELEWARVYQFTRTHASTSSGKTPRLANLKCFNLP